MKKIHKKIIAIQARAMARAVKQVKFSKTREFYNLRGGPDAGLRRVLCINHQMFHYSLNKAGSSKPAIQAKLMRLLFEEFMWLDSKNNAAYFRKKHGRTRPVRHESCWFDFKAYITGQMIGRPDLVRSNFSSMAPSIIDWIHAGAKGIFVYKDRYDRLIESSRQSPWKQLNNVICNIDQGGIKPDETIIFGAPTDVECSEVYPIDVGDSDGTPCANGSILTDITVSYPEDWVAGLPAKQSVTTKE